MKAHCKRHPERPCCGRGLELRLCASCFSLWRYHNEPGRKEIIMGYVTRHQNKVRCFRPKSEVADIPGIKEGVRVASRRNILSFSRAEDASLEACLKRRGLVRRPFMSRWRQAA